jgi:hypothetical protein
VELGLQNVLASHGAIPVILAPTQGPGFGGEVHPVLADQKDAGFAQWFGSEVQPTP